MSAEFQAVCYEFYERLHAEQPVYRMPGTGVYLITRYDDVRAAALNFETFSNTTPIGMLQGERWSAYEEVLEKEGWPMEPSLNAVDPPRHRRSRKYLDAILNHRSVEALVPRLEEVAERLIDGFAERRECEFVSEFAVLFPSIIVSEQVGFDTGNIDTFIKWSQNLTRINNFILSEDELRECARLEAGMQHYLDRVMEDRRANPRNDLLTRLVAENNPENVENEPLTPGELQNMLRWIVAGGFGTVINMLGNSLHLLLTHPDQMAKLRARPELMKNFVEECLRIETSVQILPRLVMRDVELGGVPIPKGSIIGLHFGAANHDAGKFPDPHRFDIERENAGSHLTFNTGPHLCPGRLLARQELQIAFTAILRRMADIELARPLPHPPHAASWRHRMIRELPIRFSSR